MSNADELVRRSILRKYREQISRMGDSGWAYRASPHLATCPDIDVIDPDALDGRCSEGTCPRAELIATLRCPHGEEIDYEWGTFGDLNNLIALLEREERELAQNPGSTS